MLIIVFEMRWGDYNLKNKKILTKKDRLCIEERSIKRHRKGKENEQSNTKNISNKNNNKIDLELFNKIKSMNYFTNKAYPNSEFQKI